MTRIRNVRNTTKFKRSIKAISPVIATLLMIAIAVVASLVVYAWVTGYMGTTTTKAGKAIQIQSYAPTGSNLLVYVQNVGQGDVQLSQAQSVYVDSSLVTISSANPPSTWPLTLPVGQTVELTVPLPSGYVQGDTLNIKVTTTDGTFMTATGTGTSSSGGSGTTASITLGQISGVAGSTVTLTGSNFAVTSAITVKFDTTTLTTTPATVTTTAAGAIPSGVSFTIPGTASTGSHTITVTDASSNYASTTYTVTTVNPVATKLAFSSGGAQSLTVNVVSGAIVVQRQDASNNPVATGTSQITVALTSSGTGTFYSDAAGTTVITSINIAAGASDSAGFYYKATAVGTGTHTLTGASAGLTSATTPFTISAANPVATKLAFSSGGAQSLTVNVVSGAIVVQRQDASNNPVATGTSQITVALTSSGTGTFYSDAAGTTVITSINIAAGASDSAGFYYKATAVGTGTHTLTGASAGLTSATTPFTISAAAAPTLDVPSIITGSRSAGSSYTITLSTTNANEIVYVAVTTHNNVASVAGGALGWTARGNTAITYNRNLQTFWALKPTSGSLTITITLTASDTSSAIAFGVNGANTVSPFDTTNPAASAANSAAPSTTISTTHANDLIIGLVGVHNTGYTITQGTGFTNIGSITNNDPEVGAEYKAVTTTQTNLAVGCTLSGGGNDWAMIADAIKGP